MPAPVELPMSNQGLLRTEHLGCQTSLSQGQATLSWNGVPDAQLTWMIFLLRFGHKHNTNSEFPTFTGPQIESRIEVLEQDIWHTQIMQEIFQMEAGVALLWYTYTTFPCSIDGRFLDLVDNVCEKAAKLNNKGPGLRLKTAQRRGGVYQIILLAFVSLQD
ncbi:hypothetical protein BDP27DRAFT_1377875 [Rhodocollybia butyracea]|uniref:Uncharacterized protein n=1 Tax=Rhodocollybia butyracea TaxID=206335 RepID=A0A9P5TVP8_9AGAR|nr:hypothetical protein BDP27DRAFT_1377875 [Rhodocollybia butyracea]